MMSRSRLRLVELYAGTARSAQPFLGWRRCALSLLVDSNPLAVKTYKLNFPRAPYVLEDLTQMTADRLVSQAGGKIDILLGCPPCQGFSDAGSRDPYDPRNAHLDRFGSLAAALRPLAVGMENVPLAAGTTQFWEFVRAMEKMGYRWTAGILNAALWGSAQCRQRLVYIAIREDARIVPEIPQPSYGGKREYFSYRFGCMKTIESDPVSMLGETPATRRVREILPYQESQLGSRDIPNVGEVLCGLPVTDADESFRLCHRPWAHTAEQLRRMEKISEGGRWPGGRDHFSQSYGRLHRKGLARTITTYFSNSGSGRFWHPTENRALTLREAARIQGFPDTFNFLPPFSRAVKLVGNALDKSIASITYDVIRACLE